MRIVLALLMSFLLLHSQVYAFHGGLEPNADLGGSASDGTYSATINGDNMIGMAFFGVSGNQESNGRWAVFRDGISFIGKAIATIDTNTRKITGVFLGSRQFTLASVDVAFPVDRNLDGVDDGVVVVTLQVRVLINADGGFRGELETMAPNFEFSGEGQFGFTQSDLAGVLAVVSTAEAEFKIGGLRTSTAFPVITSVVPEDVSAGF